MKTLLMLALFLVSFVLIFYGTGWILELPGQSEPANPIRVGDSTMDGHEWLAKGWTVQKQFIGSASLRSVSFGSSLEGWITGINARQISATEFDSLRSSHIYKTEDGGISWVEVNLPTSEKICIGDVVFVNAKLGWIGAQPNDCGVRGGGFVLFNTTDGGKTWKNVFSRDDFVARKILRDPTGDGWLIGNSRNRKANSIDLFRTADNGQSWELIVSLADDRNSVSKIEGVQDSIDDAVEIEPGKLTLLKRDGSILAIEFDGEKWNDSNIGRFEGGSVRRKFVRVNHLAMTSLGSSISTIKVWSEIFFNNKSKASSSIFDSLFVVSTAFDSTLAVAAGFSNGFTKIDDRRTRQEQHAVVVASEDLGITWEKIYDLTVFSSLITDNGPGNEYHVEMEVDLSEGRRIPIRFLSLIKSDPSTYFLVGDHGLVVKLTRLK